MRLGFGLLQTGKNTGPDDVSSVARRAEELAYDSLWVFDRLLYPVKPQSPYPAGDGSLPDLYRRVLDPVEALTFVAGQTNRIALGTSVLNLPWYNPILLARRLTTLDVFSKGRLRVGLETGSETTSTDLHGGVHSGRDETRGPRGERLVSGRHSVIRCGTNVRLHQGNGPRGRSQCGFIRTHHPRECAIHAVACHSRSRQFHRHAGADR
jgi:alkanesulfonate monooxygenase SsuD/methylene tetrahydromethanopterin reductase-like flavin-dependent oxidoreductase (luciferase family)